MRPIANYSLHSADKADIPAEIHKYRFYELCDQYGDYCRIYTDGSKAGERVTLEPSVNLLSCCHNMPTLSKLCLKIGILFR